MVLHHPLINNAAEMRSKVRLLICSSHPSLYKAAGFLANGSKSASNHVLTCGDDENDKVFIRCCESQLKKSPHSHRSLLIAWLLARSKSISQHVLMRLVSPAVHTTMSCFDSTFTMFDAPCITNSANNKVMFWRILCHQKCTHKSHVLTGGHCVVSPMHRANSWHRLFLHL